MLSAWFLLLPPQDQLLYPTNFLPLIIWSAFSLYPTLTKGTPTVYLEHGQTIHISSHISPTHFEPRSHAFFLRKDCLLLVQKRWTVSPARYLRWGKFTVVSRARLSRRESLACETKFTASLKNLVAGSKPKWIQFGFGNAASISCCTLLQGTKPTKGAGDALPFSLLFHFHDVSSCIYKPAYVWAAQ